MFRKLLLAIAIILACAAEAQAQTQAPPFTEPTVYTRRFSATLFNSAATTLTEIQAAPAAGLSIYVTDVHMSASVAATATADQQLTLKYGTGSNCATGTTTVYSYFNAANAGPAGELRVPIKLPAATALCFIHAAVGSKSVIVNGFIAP